MRKYLIALGVLFSLGASCRTIPDDKSAFASDAGQSTIVLGACETGFNLGWGQCLLEKGAASFPTLKFIMTNKGEWAVSDCALGLYKTGAADKPGIVEVDLSALKSQLDAAGMCILKIETIEKYPDPRDKDQMRSIYMRGGLFLEQVDPGYFPTPSPDVIGFCVKVYRTNKGRTVLEACK